MATYTENYNLKKPDPEDFVDVEDLNRNADAIDFAVKTAHDLADDAYALAEKAKVEYTSLTLEASKWKADGVYSFEILYPNASYNLSVEPNSTCTEAQLNAWSDARIVGSATTNVIKAFGNIPAVNIPIILEVREK